MVSRRRFLQSNLVGLALPFASADVFAAGQHSAERATSPEVERDYWNDWPRYMVAKMNEARAQRLNQLHSLRSEADVRARIDKVRDAIWKSIGGPFEKTPLNARTVGKIDRGDYTIEKVIFESHPQIYVTANLYVPGKQQPPHPAIISPLGHSENGKAYRSYVYLYQTLARKGYMVLAYDPFGQGERYQYLDPRTGKPIYGPTGEHDQAGYPMLLFGSTFAQYRTWDGVRAVDYLFSRPEVDPERIGCTGQSGGGTMTMYLAALEPRIKVAVEADGNSENIAGPSYAPPGGVADAEQNLVNSLPYGIDRGDLLMAFAPKPLLMCYTPIDRGVTYSPTYAEGTKEVYAEVQAAYKLMGADEKVQLFASPLPHDYDFFNRRAAYGWFNRWLGSPEWGTDEAAFEQSPPGALDCTSTGQVLTSLGGRSVVQLSTEQMRKILPPSPLGSSLSDAQAFRESARNTLKQLLALPTERTALSPKTISSNSRHGVMIEEFNIHSEPSIRICGWFLKPAEGSGPFPTVLYVSDRNKNEAVEETSEMIRLAEQGFAVCSVDLRGLGDSLPHSPAAGPVFFSSENMQEDYALACLTLGRPVLGQRTWDFIRCLDYLGTRPDVDHNRIYGLGERGTALVVLLSSVLDDRLKSILLDRPVATLRSIVESESYSLELPWFLYGILKHFDLPDLVGTLVPRRCWLLNATNADGEPVPRLEMASAYENAVKVYNQSNVELNLKFLVRTDREKAEALHKWLEST